MANAAPTLTLQDIADLARVKRPVVSMWRRRPTVRGEAVPFPEAVERASGVERFKRDDIVDWLEKTGRGNNAEARLDAPTLSVPAGIELEDLVTLVCLRERTGTDLAPTTAQERVHMTIELDPRDEFLRAEVAAMNPDREALRFVDELVDASFGPAEALARLEAGPLRRAQGDRDLTPEAVQLIRTVAAASALHIDPDGVPLIADVRSTGLMVELAEAFTHLVIPTDGPESRALRRRAVIRGIDTQTAVTDPGVRVVSVVGADPDRALDELDEAVVELGAGDIAVLLGPATIMCEALRHDAEHQRSQTLRPGNLALALRLPRGLWRSAHRQALGLWVCAGGPTRTRPFVADLSAFTQDERDLADLAADTAAALSTDRSRAFRYARPHDLQLILSAQAAVVPRGARAIRLGSTDSSGQLKRIHAATLITAEPVRGFDVLAAEAPGAAVLRRRPLGELCDAKHVQVRRGRRINSDHADPAGTIAVLAADAPTPILMLDPIDAERFYPGAARTEPGDVVFAEKPRPQAHVDPEGGSLVAAPSKILRLGRAAGIGPHTMAAIINQLPAEAREWQAWSAPLLDSTDAELLDATLAAATEYETTLRSHLGAAHALKNALIDGVAAGAVTLHEGQMEGP